MATPVFQTTQVGLDRAQSVADEGLKVRITEFRLGTGVGYTPSDQDTALRGVQVYAKAPSARVKTTVGGIEVVCVVEPNEGPFLFGEIGLYLEDGTLFALAAYGTLQEKATVAANGASNKITFRCFLNLSMSPSVFIVTSDAPVIPEVSNTSFVTSPVLMLNSPNALLVNESVLGGDNLLLTKVTPNRWLLNNFMTGPEEPVISVSPSFLTVTSAAFKNLNLLASPGTYCVQDNLGNVRVVSSVSVSNSSQGTVTLAHPLSGLTVANEVRVHTSINLLL